MIEPLDPRTLFSTPSVPTASSRSIPTAAIVLGEPLTLDLSPFATGLESVTDWSVDWGDGFSSTLPSPAGTLSRDYPAPGQYQVSVTANTTDGPQVFATLLSVRRPTLSATLVSATLRPDRTTYRLVVQYAGDLPIDASTITTTPLTVTGPRGGGPTGTIELVSVSPAAADGSLLVTYDVTGPDARDWTFQDNGTYTLSLPTGTIRDTRGNPLPGGDVGTFLIDLTRPNSPDLLPRFVAADHPTALTAGRRHRITLRLTNDGPRALSTTTPVVTRLYLSADAAVDPPDVLVATSRQPLLLQPGQSRPISFDFLVPASLPAGLARTDATNLLPETSDTNNTAASRPLRLQRPAPDLTVRFTSPLNPTYRPGQSLPLTLRLSNIGTARATGPITLRLFLTPATSSTTTSPLFNTALPITLKPGSHRPVTLSIPLPPAATPNQPYRLIAKLTAPSSADRVPTNNTTASTPFTLTRAAPASSR